MNLREAETDMKAQIHAKMSAAMQHFPTPMTTRNDFATVQGNGGALSSNQPDRLEVPQRVDRLHRSSHILASNLETLALRLGTVLRPAAAKCEKRERSEDLTSLGCMLSEIDIDLQVAGEAIVDLIDRLEL